MNFFKTATTIYYLQTYYYHQYFPNFFAIIKNLTFKNPKFNQRYSNYKELKILF